MADQTLTVVVTLTIFALLGSVAGAKGKKKMSEKEMFGSKSLRCLVCKALVDEMEYKIGLVDPKKKIEKVASFRMDGSGQQAKKTRVS